MKVCLSIIVCCLALAAVPVSEAAEVIIHEYPDRVVVECDGSKDAVQPSTPTETAGKKGSSSEHEQRLKAYKARMATRTEAIEKRLEARQSRWTQMREKGGNP
jgi:hypothetical protein